MRFFSTHFRFLSLSSPKLFTNYTTVENKRLFIETYGCQMNVADSEVIGSILKVAGYEVCDEIKDADLIRDRREGKYIYYELNTSVLEEIMLWVADLKGENENETDKEQ